MATPRRSVGLGSPQKVHNVGDDVELATPSKAKRIAKRKKSKKQQVKVAENEAEHSNAPDENTIEGVSCNVEDLRSKKVVELREIMRRLGLKTAGRKEELVQRIVEHLSESCRVSASENQDNDKDEQQAMPLQAKDTDVIILEDNLPESIEPISTPSLSAESEDPDAILRALEMELEREEAERRSVLEEELGYSGQSSQLRTAELDEPLSLPFPTFERWPTESIPSNQKVVRRERRKPVSLALRKQSLPYQQRAYVPVTSSQWAFRLGLIALFIALFMRGRYEDTQMLFLSCGIGVVVLILLCVLDYWRSLSNRNSVQEGGGEVTSTPFSNATSPPIDMTKALNEAEDVLNMLRDYRERLSSLVEKQRHDIEATEKQILQARNDAGLDGGGVTLIHTHLNVLNQRARRLRKARRDNVLRLKEIEAQSAELEHMIATKRVEGAFKILNQLHTLSSVDASQCL